MLRRPEFARPLGKPLGAAQRLGEARFRREFEHLVVTLDCAGNMSTHFEWR